MAVFLPRAGDPHGQAAGRRVSRLAAVMTLAAGLMVAPTGSPGGAGASEPVGSPQRYLILYQAGHGVPSNVAEELRLHGGRLIRSMPEVGLAVASGDSGFASSLERTPHVQAVVPDEPVLADFGQAAGSVSLEAQFTLQSEGPRVPAFFDSQWNMRAIEADAAWAAGYRGDPSVTVAIVDSGVDATPRDLTGVVDAARSASFVEDIPGLPQCFDDALIATHFPGAPEWADLHTHGTHVSGIVAAQGHGVSGVAPDVTLIAVKVVNVCNLVAPSWAIAGAVHAADAGADVINLSLAITFPRSCRTESDRGDLRNQCAATLSALNRAAAYAHQRGAIMVAAAGNSGIDFDHARDVTVVPADLPTVMGVSATAPLNGRDPDSPADYTNYGRSLVDVAAPGGRVAGGEDMVLSLCSNFSLLYAECRGMNTYQYRAGTSFSAPHVSGTAALVASAHDGNLDGAQLQSIIARTSDDPGTPGNDPFFGRGRVNAFRAATN